MPSMLHAITIKVNEQLDNCQILAIKELHQNTADMIKHKASKIYSCYLSKLAEIGVP